MKRAAAAMFALALTGCQVSHAAQAEPVQFALGRDFTLGGGQEAFLRDTTLRLRFTDVPEDSRCPAQVECFWTGQARITVVVESSGSGSTTLEFNTNPAPGINTQSATVDGYTIALKSLDPYPQTPHESMPLEDYRATMTVRQG